MGKFHLFSFLIVSILTLGGCAHYSTPSRSIAASRISDFQLPKGIERIIYNEQVLISRELNARAIISPKLNAQEEFYKPESRNVFELKTYWITEDDLHTFKANSLDEDLAHLMIRTKNGVREWRLIVHPESENFYRELIEKGTPAEDFYATSTSSSRTLVIWPPENPELAFFGKLSLDRKIGGVVRTIPAREIANSLGVMTLLSSIEQDLPSSFRSFPETIGIMPKNLERGGMIIRQIPKKIKNGEEDFLPLFSLYAQCANCNKKPLIIDMINKSGMSTENFIREKIISPFLDQWIELAIKEGIIMEPHAQNALIGIGKNELPNGLFLHRDFGGFNIDLNFRKNAGLKIPDNMPMINSFKVDYHQNSVEEMVKTSLHTYFVNGFIYNLDQKLSAWAEEGLIPAYQKRIRKNYFQNMVFEELAKKLKTDKGTDLRNPESFNLVINKLKNDFLELRKKADQADQNDCFNIMKSFFFNLSYFVKGR